MEVNLNYVEALHVSLYIDYLGAGKSTLMNILAGFRYSLDDLHNNLIGFPTLLTLFFTIIVILAVQM